MGNMEFKIEMYFQMYKDTPLENRGKFKQKFIKKHGNFQYLNEVVIQIERYQIKKYGELLYRPDAGILKDRHEVRKILNASKHREHYKKR